MKLNEIYVGNCFELVNQIEDNSIDLIVCDGPYGVTDFEWDKISDIRDFNFKVIETFSRVLKPGGALYLFGKRMPIDPSDCEKILRIASEIIWFQPSRLAQGRKNYTNNSDTIVYFIKPSGEPTFNLDDIRVPQLVDEKQRKRVESVPSVTGGKYNKTKYNEMGKNPGNVWSDIKQLTYKSKELVNKEFLNTIQKPEALIERIVKASSNKGDVVLDPFSGVGTTFAVCKKLERNFIGFEINPEYVEIIKKRCN
jgi:site-specific DNA-methyltransferase (adenine-specific)/adenine-specific DNA-methyltransferase